MSPKFHVIKYTTVHSSNKHTEPITRWILNRQSQSGCYSSQSQTGCYNCQLQCGCYNSQSQSGCYTTAKHKVDTTVNHKVDVTIANHKVDTTVNNKVNKFLQLCKQNKFFFRDQTYKISTVELIRLCL